MQLTVIDLQDMTPRTPIFAAINGNSKVRFSEKILLFPFANYPNVTCCE